MGVGWARSGCYGSKTVEDASLCWPGKEGEIEVPTVPTTRCDWRGMENKTNTSRSASSL